MKPEHKDAAAAEPSTPTPSPTGTQMSRRSFAMIAAASASLVTPLAAHASRTHGQLNEPAHPLGPGTVGTELSSNTTSPSVKSRILSKLQNDLAQHKNVLLAGSYDKGLTGDHYSRADPL